MNITKNQDGTKLTISLEGRLDTLTAPALEDELNGCYEGLSELTFDMSELSYLSSAGIRVLIGAFRSMYAQGGTMKLVNLNEMVQEVLDLTGAARVFNIQ